MLYAEKVLFKTLRMTLSSKENNALIKIIPVLITAVLLITTMALWEQERDASYQAKKAYFDFRVREAVANIEARMDTYQQVLHGARGLYEASENVSRKEFRNYVFSLHLNDNFPGIQGVGFSLIIPPEKKDEHLISVRKEGYPEYNIRPEGERDPFTSIVYLEPLADRNLRAFGYDMFSDPVRREAMERARDTNEPAMSGKVRLVQESGKDEQAGFLIYVPVYKNGLPHDNLSNRQANIIGWIYSPFRMGDLMEGIFGEWASDIDVGIYDGEQISAESLMHDSSNEVHPDSGHSMTALGKAGNIALFTTKTLVLAGHTWTISIRALPSINNRVGVDNSLPVLIVGITGSLLFGSIAWLLINGRQRALRTARELNTQYIESQTTLQAILDSSAVGVAWANSDGILEYINPKFTAMFGYSHKDVPTVEQWYLRAYPDPAYRKKIVTQWNAMLEETIDDGSDLPPLEVEITCKDGSVKNVVLLGSRAGSKLVVIFNDVTERKQSEELTAYMAQHDALTGLPNRHLFNDRLEHAVSLAKRENHLLAVLFIDLDKFKVVNDTHGHDMGDRLLKEAAKRIKECLRESDVVARMGGDEFMVLINNPESEENAKLVSEKIRFVLNLPYVIDGQSLEGAASIGVAIYPEHGDNESSLARNADLAMYSAKQKGRNAVALFEPEKG